MKNGEREIIDAILCFFCLEVTSDEAASEEAYRIKLKHDLNYAKQIVAFFDNGNSIDWRALLFNDSYQIDSFHYEVYEDSELADIHSLARKLLFEPANDVVGGRPQ